MTHPEELNKETKLESKLLGCLVGGAIGDAIGSYHEGQAHIESVEFDIFSGITDDTQLTLATCESIIVSGRVSAEGISKCMLDWYNRGKLRGLGTSTLKALRDLQMGAHWGLSGRAGEYAAGNGAAMRIAPLAFLTDVDTERTLIRDVCNITHKNDEAYVGCLAVLYALQFVIAGKELANQSLIDHITSVLPDAGVRDNLLKIKSNPGMDIHEVANLVGTSGHVIQSVPFSIFSAQLITEAYFEDVISAVIACGGDTDTNASLTGQIMGAYLGIEGFSPRVKTAFNNIQESSYILQVGSSLANMLKRKK